MEWYLKVVRDNYANFNGRARRKEYWMFALFNILIVLGLSLIFGFIGSMIDMPALAFVSYLYLLAVLVPSLAVTVRRLHDVGKSGWWVLLSLVPLASLVILVFTVMDSQPGENQWGPNPKGIGNNGEIDKIGSE